MTAHSSESDKGNDKRVRILEAAEVVFARNGFYHSKVSDVAKEAGVADGTIYLYFKNKDDLLISLFESRMEHAIAELKTAISKETSAAGQMRALLTRHFEMVGENPSVAEVLTVELRQSSKFMKEYSPAGFAGFLKLIAGIVARGIEGGEFETEIPPQHVARMIFGVIDELALTWLLGGKEKFAIELAPKWAYDLAISGLRKRKE